MLHQFDSILFHKITYVEFFIQSYLRKEYTLTSMLNLNLI